MDWYVPGENEISAVRCLLQRYLDPSLNTLVQLSKKEIDLDKEAVLRNLRQVYRVVYGSSEVLAPVSMNNDELNERESCSPSTVETIERLITSLDKKNVRHQVLEVNKKNLICEFRF